MVFRQTAYFAYGYSHHKIFGNCVLMASISFVKKMKYICNADKADKIERLIIGTRKKVARKCYS